MASGVYFNGFFQALDDAGDPLSLGTVESFVAGSATHKPLFTTSALAVQHAWPYQLNGAGRGQFFLEAGAYDLFLKDADGAVLDTLEDFQSVGANVSLVSTTGPTYTVDFGSATHVLVLVDASG